MCIPVVVVGDTRFLFGNTKNNWVKFFKVIIFGVERNLYITEYKNDGNIVITCALGLAI